MKVRDLLDALTNFGSDQEIEVGERGGKPWVRLKGEEQEPPPHLAALEDVPTCNDCPIGGRESGGEVCPRSPLCDWECQEQNRLIEAEQPQSG